MNRDEYVAELRHVLDAASNGVVEKLDAILAHVTAQVTSVEVIVFPGQDDNGAFDVHAGFGGPNSATLNAPIAAIDICSAWSRTRTAGARGTRIRPGQPAKIATRGRSTDRREAEARSARGCGGRADLRSGVCPPGVSKARLNPVSR